MISARRELEGAFKNTCAYRKPVASYSPNQKKVKRMILSRPILVSKLHRCGPVPIADTVAKVVVGLPCRSCFCLRLDPVTWSQVQRKRANKRQMSSFLWKGISCCVNDSVQESWHAGIWRDWNRSTGLVTIKQDPKKSFLRGRQWFGL